MFNQEEVQIRTLEERIAALEHENELLKRNRDFEKIVQNAPVGIYRTTLDGKVLMVNSKFAKMFGFSSPEEFAAEVKDVTNDLYYDQSLRQELIASANATNGFIKQEGVFKKRDGSLFSARYRTRAIKDSSGDIRYFEGVMEDVSEHLRMSEALERSEELLRSLLESTPDGILLFDMKTSSPIFFNKEEFCGYSKEFILKNKDYLEYVHPDDKVALEEVRQRVFKGRFQKKIETTEYRLMDAAGHWQWIENRYALVSRDEAGFPKQFLVMLSIITERKKSEEKLKESWKLYSVLVDALPEVVVIADLEGKLEFISPNVEQLSLGESQSSVTGTNLFDWIAPEQHEEAAKNIARLVEEDYALHTYRLVRRDGTDFLGKVHTRVVRDDEGNPIRMVSIIQDITEEINSIKALRISEERFRELFEQAQVGMAIIDDHNMIVRANLSIRGMLGYANEELTTLKLLQLMPRKRQKKARTEIKELMAGKVDEVMAEMQFLTKEGQNIHVLLQIIKLDPVESYVNQYLCQVVNIDALKRVESELKTRNKELNNIVYKVSHDLKAPLMSVKGLANLMRLENDPKLHFTYINLIEERIQKLEGFIRDILSHSRNLNTEVQLSDVEVGPLIEQCFNQIAYHPNFKYIDRIIDVKISHVRIDETRFFEIMRNLVSNAVIYSCPSERESYVKVRVWASLKTVKIEVEDNGVGIDPDHVDRIFEMFYRANEDIEGTGIGLYIVQQSIDNLQGRIKVESELEKGSKFTIELPNLLTD